MTDPADFLYVAGNNPNPAGKYPVGIPANYRLF
jgi:hypothetical protein